MIQENVPLAPFCTLGVGGPARFLARADTRDALRQAIAWGRERGLPVLFLGGGSNLVMADGGFPGLVIHLALTGRETEDGRVRAAAGESWDALVADAVGRGWAGVECLSGIPGSVGATPIQNVGAYGQEVAETIAEVEVLELESGETRTLANAECGFGYRDSRFKREDRGRFVVLSVTFALRPGGEPSVRYAELERQLGSHAGPATLGAVRETVIGLRRGKSMVLDPGDPNARSVGSFFMNPIVASDVYAGLEGRLAEAAGPGGHVPVFPAGPGRVKLSAAWLIERAGVARGHARGRAGVSTRHTLALVNRGGATAAEIVALAREVRGRVEERFGVTLEPEPVLVGVSLDESV